MKKNFENKEKNSYKNAPMVCGKYTKAQKHILSVSVITSFITTFMGSALNLSIPAIEEEYSVSAAMVGWIITIYMLTCAALAVPFGKIGDIVDRKKILWFGILIFTLSSVSAIFSGKLWVLLLFRFLQGVGASMIFSTNIAILVGSFEEKERGKVLGYTTGANYLGLSCGPVLGGILNYNFGWRSVFISTAIVSGAALYFAGSKLTSKEKEIGFQTPISFDFRGSFLYIAAIVSGMYGLSVFNSMKFGWAIFSASIVLFFLFVRTESRAEEPILKMSLFRRNGSYVCANIAALLNYGANFTISYLLSIYLQVVMGYTSQTAGIILIASPVVQAAFSPIMGKLSDQRSPQIISAFGMVLCSISLFFYGFLTEVTPLWLILVALAVTGVGFAMFSSPNTNAVMTSTKRRDYGVASSVLATMRSIGHTSSMAVVTIVVGLYMGAESLTNAPVPRLLQTMHTCFFLFGGLCILGFFIALKRKV